MKLTPVPKSVRNLLAHPLRVCAPRRVRRNEIGVEVIDEPLTPEEIRALTDRNYMGPRGSIPWEIIRGSWRDSAIPPELVRGDTLDPRVLKSLQRCVRECCEAYRQHAERMEQFDKKRADKTRAARTKKGKPNTGGAK